MSDARTIKLYDKRVADYAKLSAVESKSNPALVSFIKDLSKGHRVLDLGCGPGFAAAQMAQAGLLVDATDASSEMVDMANRADGVTAWQATFDEITGTAIYHGIWASFSLLHAPRGDMSNHLSALHKALKPGGKLCIGMKLGIGEARDGIGRLYTYYSQDELTALLTKTGFTVINATTGSGIGLDGTSSDWVSLAAHG